MPRHTGRCGHRPLHTAYRNPMRHIRADRAVRPYTRLPHPHFVLILSFRASVHTGVGIRIPAPAGAESPKPPLCKGRCRPQGDGGIVIAGRGRAPPLRTFIETCTHGGVWSRRPTNYLRRQNISNQRPWPPPTFAASRQRRDLIIAQTPGGCFQRGRAAALPLWSLKDGGFSRGKEDRNFLPP